jgi:hypothetical protein
MAVSQNGWPVNPPRQSRLVAGTALKLVVADGPAGDLLLRFASDFDRLVEDIDTARGGQRDDWGWADREIRGGGDISNHASGTAIDLNALRHALGATGTFTHAEQAALRRLLDRYEGVIRWGGDYSGRRDEMHFEINADEAAVRRVLARLSEEDDDMSWDEKLRDGTWTPGGDGTARHAIAYIHQFSQRNWNVAPAVAALTAAVAADKDIAPADLNKMVDAAVAKHTPTAAQTAAALLPMVEDIAERVLGADNEDLAAEFLRQLRSALPDIPEGN